MRRLTLLPLVAAIGLLAGCGGTEEPGVASADPGPATTTAAAPTPSTSSSGPAKAAGSFSECMQNHGVEVAEPAPGKGLTGIDPALADTPAFKTALAACKDLLPGATRPSGEPADIQKYLEFAKCMRSNGMPDFPDPKPGGSGGMFPGVDRTDPAFQKAAKKCDGKLAGPGQ